jgi:hypothetical protein
MFATIMRRTKGVKVLECHVFICKSNKAAMALVQSCTHAYEHKEGWTDDSPPVEMHKTTDLHLVPADPIKHDEAPPEFFKRPPQQGYYYASGKNMVKNYNVFGNNPPPEPIPEEPPMRRTLPPAPREPPPPMAGRGMYVTGPPPPAPPPPAPVPVTVGPPMTLVAPVPYLPPPPAGYFNDWNNYGDTPVVVFPPPPPPEEIYAHRSRSRPRHRSPEVIYRSTSPRPRRHLSPSPRRYYIADGFDEPEYYERRARTPPVDYEQNRPRRRRQEYVYDYYPTRGDPNDLILFADGYNKDPDEYGYGRTRSPRRHASPDRRRDDYLFDRPVNGKPFERLDETLGYLP